MRSTLIIASWTLLLALLTPALAEEPTPKALIAGHLKAIGGADAYRAIQTTKRKALIKIPAQGMEMEAIFYTKRPHFVRQEIQVMGMEIIQATNGEAPWMINPMRGDAPQLMPEPQATMYRRMAHYDDLFFDAPAQRDLTLKYEGTVARDDATFHQMRVTYPNGDVQDRFYHAETGLLTSLEQAQMNQQGHMEQTVVTFTDYRAVNGVKFPHRLVYSNGQEVTFSDVEVNVAMPDKLFAMPQ